MKLPSKTAEIVNCKTREGWLAERTKTVGASDSPALIGQGDGEGGYGSPVSVYRSKTEPDQISESCERFDIAHAMEPVVCNLYARKFGGRVDHWDQSTLVRDMTLGPVHCTPDALALDPERNGVGLLQIKTWSEFDQRSWDAGVPLPIQIQTQQELAVTGCQWGYVAVLFGCQRIERFEVPRNDRFIAALLAAVKEFWRYVVERECPPVDASLATARALSLLHPEDNGLAVHLPTEAEEVLDSLTDAKETIKTAEQQKKHAENQLKAWIGDNTFGVTPSGRACSWKSQTRKAHMVAESTFRVLRADCKLPKQIEFTEAIDYAGSRRKTLPKETKRRLLEQDNHCHWCGSTLTMATATTEHLVPLSKGGTNEVKNLALACEKCNHERGDHATLPVEVSA